jgi:hypothetical protein
MALEDVRYAARRSAAVGPTADIRTNPTGWKSAAFDPDVWSGRAVQGVSSILAMRSCIDVSGLLLEHVLPAIMDISAHAI